jgi:hypothetical protein
MVLTGKSDWLGEKPVPVLLCPPQIPHGLPWERTQASAMRIQRLIIWAMERSAIGLISYITTFVLSFDVVVSKTSIPNHSHLCLIWILVLSTLVCWEQLHKIRYHSESKLSCPYCYAPLLHVLLHHLELWLFLCVLSTKVHEINT